MLNVLTKIRTFHQPFTGKFSKLQILLIERVLRLIERDYTHWKGLVVLTCELHNDYSHSTGSMYMAWVSASSCHPFKGEISRDKSNYLTVSYSLRNIERRVIWFEGVLFIEKYQNMIQMIRMCHNPCEKYRKTSHMIWTCPIH